ncbi:MULTISPECIES: hypothetical protein [unclassified Chelatococcus]|uniref:hypothetical protein n=1 Tax=unclassified Chelatococcus TaxID=2638111 RepID=UPI001BCCA870|nr:MULTISPECIES: hypothetical protein [unclassified Chelatococcus]MBS7699517.1 hypothetical protein [Chelatococcus sp. YT9]MBX3559564.1 hypothetical protein [Chelatococcus sp.]
MAVVRLHHNPETQTVTLSDENNPAVALEIDAAQLEQILQGLGEMRARMEPRVEADWQPGRPVQAITNPRFSAELPQDKDFTVLHLRDPRFGWLHYAVPFPECGRLAEFLARAVKRKASPEAPQQH